MKQICYAITSSGLDIYSEQTFVSASLARRLYPKAKILLVVDELTDIALKDCGDRILDLADEVVCIVTGMDKPVARNRVLKTTMRNYIEDDFLYLDADTVPIRRFDEFFDHGASFAAVPDYTEQLFGLRRAKWVKKLYMELDWPYPTKNFFNGGALFFADKPETHEFSRQWHQRWLRCVNETNTLLDQPSLNSAIDAVGLDVKTMPLEFNCAVQSTIFSVRRARIFHYFTSQVEEEEYSLLDYLVKNVRDTGDLDWQAVERAMATGDPYVSHPPDVKRSITSGRYAHAVRLIAGRAMEGLKFGKLRSKSE